MCCFSDQFAKVECEKYGKVHRVLMITQLAFCCHDPDIYTHIDITPEKKSLVVVISAPIGMNCGSPIYPRLQSFFVLGGENMYSVAENLSLIDTNERDPGKMPISESSGLGCE